jgi:inner membrane protease subunit 1
MASSPSSFLRQPFKVLRTKVTTSFRNLKNNPEEKRAIARDIGMAIGVTAGMLAFCEYFYQITLCIGPSMEPTFDTDGELAILDKFSLNILGRRIQKGEVVVAVCKTDPTKRVCKRILALENELVVREQLFGPPTYTVVPPGHVYLKGDNPFNSTG